jgi:hypothetical protein
MQTPNAPLPHTALLKDEIEELWLELPGKSSYRTLESELIKKYGDQIKIHSKVLENFIKKKNFRTEDKPGKTLTAKMDPPQLKVTPINFPISKETEYVIPSTQGDLSINVTMATCQSANDQPAASDFSKER